MGRLGAGAVGPEGTSGLEVGDRFQGKGQNSATKPPVSHYSSLGSREMKAQSSD